MTRSFISRLVLWGGVISLLAGCRGASEQAAFRKGIAAYQDKRYSEAIRLLTDAAQRITGSAELYYYLGSARLMQGELDAAYEAFNIALDSDASHGESMAGMGEVAFLRGEFPKARGLFEQALKSKLTTDSARAMALNGLALIYREGMVDERGRQKKDPARARLYLLKAQRACPTYAPTYYNLAFLYSEVYELYEEAVDEFGLYLQTADKSDPYREKATNHSKRITMQIRKQNEEKNAAPPPTRDTETAQKHLEDAIAKQGAKRYSLATRSYEAALKADPLMFNAAWGWGVTANKQKNYAEALRAFKRAIELKPGFVDAHIQAAEQAFQLRRYEEAEQLLARAIAREPFNLDCADKMVRIRFAQKRMEEVQEYGSYYLSLLKPGDARYESYSSWLQTVKPVVKE